MSGFAEEIVVGGAGGVEVGDMSGVGDVVRKLDKDEVRGDVVVEIELDLMGIYSGRKIRAGVESMESLSPEATLGSM